MHETRTIANWVANLRYEDIPEDVREHARRFILDNFGCQIAGATLPWSKTYYDMMCATRSGSHSTVALYGDRMAPDDAAFLNSTFNHANETDDTHLKSPTHPGGIAVPAALALAEFAEATGEAFLVAVVAAYEVQIRLSWACSPHLIYRGHHPPVGVGPFGAASAGAVLLGFDEETTLNALAIAGSHSAGLIEYTKTGGSVKRIHSAIPTQAGVRAALFAQAGITGPHSILEGEKGFCKVFAGEYDLNRLTDGLGKRYHLLDNGLKPYSCCHLIHAAFDALDEARRETPLLPEDVKEITVATNSEPILSHIGSITEPDDILGAQFSLPFSMAMRLHHGGEGVKGGNGFWDYTQVDFRDPALLETARKVKVVVAANDKWERVDEGAGLEIETTDGRRIKASVPFSKGLPENPMSPAEVEEKFRYLVEPVMGTEAADAIVAAVGGIESIDDINDLVRLLVTPDAPNARAAAE
ncbi:MAG: MmgE/PrpD family protein [Alphaproteobacteria bacterium]|nr:MmgE/PrpD family protein [Alphaproteobacteria bacterium]